MKPLFILGEFPVQSDITIGSKFCSPAGIELIRMMGEAGILALTSSDRDYINRYYSTQDTTLIDMIWRMHPEIHRANVFKTHPQSSDIANLCGPKSEGIRGFPAIITSKYIRAEFEADLDALADEILRVDPNLILCLGNTALWALAGRTGVKTLRGTTLLSTHTAADYKLLPTYHPIAVIRQWDTRPTVVADLSKAAIENTFPEIRRPRREIWIEPTLADVTKFFAEHIRPNRLLSVDIETSGSRITCIGFAPTRELAIVIPFDDERAKGGCYWETPKLERACWELIRRVLSDGSIPKLFQNGLYDITFLWRAYGIKVMGAAEDTMLLHHALQPEALKGLGYLGSVYSDEGSWKGMRKHETVKKED